MREASRIDAATAQSALEICVDLGLADDRIRGELTEPSGARLINVGLADLLLADVRVLGHRDRFPRQHDWENLLPLLADGEELLWIVRKERSSFRVSLGYKPNRSILEHKRVVQERFDSFTAITNGFSRRAFPETKLRWLTSEETSNATAGIHELARQSVTLVTGHPSLKTQDPEAIVDSRDPDRRIYASLNDALEPFVDEPDFALVFSICRASTVEVADELRLLSEVRDAIHPNVSRQTSVGGSRSDGGHEDGSVSTNMSTGVQERRNLVASIVQTVSGAAREGGGFRRAAASYQTSEGATRTRGANWNDQDSWNTTVEQMNSFLELVDESLEKRIRHVAQASGTSAFFGSVAVYAHDETRGLRIGRALAAALSGPHSWVRPFQVIPYRGHVADALVRRVVATKDVLPERRVVLSTAQACQLMLLPEAELPGLRLKQNVFYGRAPDEVAALGDRVEVGHSAFHTVTVEGRPSSARSRSAPEVALPLEDLFGHVLITGTTGSGKTVRAVQILNHLQHDDVRLLVIETAKKTYRHKLRRGGRPPRVFALGGSTGSRFRINPFYFEPGSSLKRHVSVLSDALADLLPVEALIGPKLREAILDCYSACGWDVETGTFDRGEEPSFPTLIDFSAKVADVAARLRYSGEINQNYQGALLGRAKLFVDDLYQDVFSHCGNLSLDELFGGDVDAILELDELPPSEIQMPSFVVSLILERLRAHALLKRQRWVVVIEEAHNILHRRREQATSQRDAGVGRHLLDQVVRLLQEGRELGIGVVVIDQSPHSLADAVLKNTNTKIVHRLVDGEETRVVGNSIGLAENEWHDLTRLEDGECIIKTKGSGRPVKLAPLRDLPEMHEHRRTDDPVPAYAASARILADLVDRGELAGVFGAAQELSRLCRNDLQLVTYVIGKHLVWRDQFPETAWDPPTSLDDVPATLLALLVPRPSASDFLDAVVGDAIAGDPRRVAATSASRFHELPASVDGFLRDLTASAEAIAGDTHGVAVVGRTLSALLIDGSPHRNDEFRIAVQGVADAISLTRALRRARRLGRRGLRDWSDPSTAVADFGRDVSPAMIAAAYDLLTREVGP